jgi:uncharacterized protein YuzB (UPF0349 family)
MNKVYLVYFGTDYGDGDVAPYTSLDKAKAAADKALGYYDYCCVTEFALVDGDYVKNMDSDYMVEKC